MTKATESERISAIARLAFARQRHTDLSRAEAAARVELAAAIMVMDEAADVAGRHNLAEQAAVNVALTAYGQALADLIRGETAAPTPA